MQGEKGPLLGSAGLTSFCLSNLLLTGSATPALHNGVVCGYAGQGALAHTMCTGRGQDRGI